MSHHPTAGRRKSVPDPAHAPSSTFFVASHFFTSHFLTFHLLYAPPSVISPATRDNLHHCRHVVDADDVHAGEHGCGDGGRRCPSRASSQAASPAPRA